MASHTYELYFTGRDDPRDGCIIMGEDTKHIFFEFETSISDYMTNAQTTISSERKPVACFEWSMGGTQLGFATIGNRHFPMSNLVMPGSSASARQFCSVDGRHFEWRSCYDDPQSYDLFTYNVRIAVFRRYPQATPVGPSHGFMQYTLVHDIPLLEALMALSLNRWIDWGQRVP
ncbi:hypothetical protein SERLA73DRAFT_142157 [Serpula lacrymans var. lacrymans S7.3]|uniref:DUF6593 domain-containing protein n=2 Tax=Serpula lacrymans var. lacrymans TaxID=341189 RepID=F8Q7B7_SERL3|nr:uncharacterized protein SERLADRAFT_398078 [Serpula lacrymans var. lacrymans S7.9]EGN95455.1 hypothetical protein SERLA73DRAFT_142157 [Serpula lacrymans var. lacrymans S7.3]EGO20985.1 hypothetical protein SERLADRAFT_398078 [Serpula lacrymans var. lacrymans S7.9]